MSASQPAASQRLTFDGAIVATAAFLSLATGAAVVVPGLLVRLDAPALDLALDTGTAMVTLAVAGLAWLRYRQHGGSMALFGSAAFLVLTTANGLTVVLVVAGLEDQAGMSLANPSQVPLYQFTVARLLAGCLLVAGGVAALRGWHPRHPVAIVLGSVLAMLAIIAWLPPVADSLPSLGSVRRVDGGATPGSPGMPMPTVLGATIQVVGAALFLLAAALARRSYRRDGAIQDAYLAVGLVFAAFAQVHTALNPGTYAGIVTSGGLLRLAFDLLLVLGVQAQVMATVASLRRANADLDRMRRLEVDRAGLAERARLSRELHDGLAQDLWLAKLKVGRLASLPRLGTEARRLTQDLHRAIDSGLSDTQQAVVALRLADDASASVGELLARCLDDFADRFGLRVQFDCDGPLPPLPARSQAELLRITQGALSNVQRHADATLVRVRVAVDGPFLELVVRDNGRGFDPSENLNGGYGLASMRERAALIGGMIEIESGHQAGTRVRLRVPIERQATALSQLTAS